MEVGGSIEDEYQKVFQRYPKILKDWIPTRNEDDVIVFIFIPPFRENQIQEITEDVAKRVAFLKSFYGAILIQRRFLVKEPKKV